LEDDVEGNLRYLREARKRSDLVIMHLHAHEWELGKGREAPGEFIQPVAHRCIDEGADVFICQGAHTLRGVEIYKHKPIFYEPQSSMGFGKVTRLPSGYYENPMYQNYSRVDLKTSDAMVLDALESRVASPLGQDLANQSFEAKSAFVGYCAFGKDMNIVDLKIYPKTRKSGEPPMLANRQDAERIVKYVERVSTMFGTEIAYKNGIGHVVIK
jgi:poly-gamma-glutamate synthesis protein (capsule biosynthesis protein)